MNRNAEFSPTEPRKPTVLLDSLARIKGLKPLDRNTLVFIFAVLATAPTLGSRTLTAGLAVAFGWALLAFCFRRFALQLDRASVLAAGAAGFYALVKVVFTLAHSGGAGTHALYGFILFLAPVFLISFLRRMNIALILNIMICGCGFSALLASPIAAYQTFWVGVRAEGGSGNPGIFAVLTLVLGSIGAINVLATGRIRFWLGCFSWLAMVFCVVSSGMRGIWIAIPVVTAILLWTGAQRVSRASMRRIIIAAIASLVIGAGLAGSMFLERSEQLADDIALIAENGDYDSSTGRRLLMYKAAAQALMEAPWAGYGIHERMNAVKAHVPAEWRDIVIYTHPHNGFLAALLDAGIAGLVAVLFLLAAPLLIAAGAERDETWRTRMAVASILTVGYVASGMTNILFEHDLMDSAFIVLLVLIASSVPTGRVRKG